MMKRVGIRSGLLMLEMRKNYYKSGFETMSAVIKLVCDARVWFAQNTVWRLLFNANLSLGSPCQTFSNIN